MRSPLQPRLRHLALDANTVREIQVFDEAPPLSAWKRAPLLGERWRPVRSQAQDTRRPSQQRFLRVANQEFPGRGIHSIQQVADEFVLNLEAQFWRDADRRHPEKRSIGNPSPQAVSELERLTGPIA